MNESSCHSAFRVSSFQAAAFKLTALNTPQYVSAGICRSPWATHKISVLVERHGGLGLFVGVGTAWCKVLFVYFAPWGSFQVILLCAALEGISLVLRGAKMGPQQQLVCGFHPAKTSNLRRGKSCFREASTDTIRTITHPGRLQKLQFEALQPPRSIIQGEELGLKSLTAGKCCGCLTNL